MSGLFRRILGWFGIVSGRVLQLDEICPDAIERLRADALEGLSTRYVPSGLTIGVSPGDYSRLSQFKASLDRMLQSRIAALVTEPGWARSSPSVSLRLERLESLGTGDSPVFDTTFNAGVEKAVFVAARRGNGKRRGARGGAKGVVLEVVITPGNENATGLQEKFLVVLGSWPHGGTTGLRTRRRETRIVPVAGMGSVEALLSVASGGQPAVIWAKAGVVVLGRTSHRAHLVPSVEDMTVSEAHLALRREKNGALCVVDLKSSNGTWIGAERVQTVREVALPVTVRIGKEGRVLVDVRDAGKRGPQT